MSASRAPVRYPLGLTLVYCDGLARAGEQLVLSGLTSALIGYDERLFPGGPLEDPRMGVRHALLLPDNGNWKLIDRGTKHGTYVDGRRTREHVLSPGEVIRIGSTFMVYGHIAPMSRALMLNSVGATMAEVEATIAGFARSDEPALLLGENGTGKELVAHELHRLSGRTGPFIALNCAAMSAEQLERALFARIPSEVGAASASASEPRDARARLSSSPRVDPLSSSAGLTRDGDASNAWPEGVFMRAQGGTVFLDEASDMHGSAQERLLALLEAGAYVPLDGGEPIAVTTRLIIATNREIDAAGGVPLLPPLYARLARWSVRLPALRERREDLGVLVRVLLGRSAPGLDVTPDMMRALVTAWFPQNIRGLIAVLTAARRAQPKVSRLDLGEASRAALVAQEPPDSSDARAVRKPL